MIGKSTLFGESTLVQAIPILGMACLVCFMPIDALADDLLTREKIPFVAEAPGQPQELGKLWGDRANGPAGTLLKVPGNWIAPVHAHTADYRAVVIEGVWKHWPLGATQEQAAELRPGSYWTQKAEQPHDDACVSTTGCVILLINENPYRTYIPKN